MDYVPTPGPLPGEQWVPSNGTVGYSFLEHECGNCARDRAMRELGRALGFVDHPSPDDPDIRLLTLALQAP